MPDPAAIGVRAIPAWEAVAVAFAIGYLLLAIRQNIFCWAAAILSTSIYAVLMLEASLYMESMLQLFYIGMAIYGWRQWRTGAAGEPLAVKTWPATRHGIAVTGIVCMAAVSGSLLAQFTQAALPYLDSLTTWGAIVSTYLVARKILENWIYWFVVDGISVYLYLSRELYLTALLFIVYLVLIVFGYRAWRNSLLARPA